MPPTLRTSISANYCQGSRVKQPQLAAQLRTFEAALPINVNSPVMAMSSSDQSRAQASQNPRKPCCNFCQGFGQQRDIEGGADEGTGPRLQGYIGLVPRVEVNEDKPLPMKCEDRPSQSL